MATATQRKLPFRYNTRQRTRTVGSQAFAAGQALTFELPRVGLLAGIHIAVAGGLIRTAGDTGAFSDRQFNILKRLTVDLNVGAASIYNCSGHGTYILNSTEKINYRPDEGGTAVPGTATQTPNAALWQDPAVYQGTDVVPNPNFPNADGLVMTYWVPISANCGRNFNIGLINLQAPEVRCVLTVQCGQVADLFAAGSVLTGTTIPNTQVVVSYVFWEVPNPDKVAFPPLMYHRVLEDRTPFSNIGDVTYLVPRQGTLLRLIHNVIANNNNQSAVNPFTIRINKTDDIYQNTNTMQHFWQRFSYGGKLPTGAVLHDFWNAEDVPATGDFRDALDSEAVSTLESILTILNVTLGVGNNFIDTQREIVQVLQV